MPALPGEPIRSWTGWGSDPAALRRDAPVDMAMQQQLRSSPAGTGRLSMRDVFLGLRRIPGSRPIRFTRPSPRSRRATACR